MRHLPANPVGYVLCRGVEGKQFVEIAVVEIVVYPVFDMLEVNNHTVCIKLLGLAINGDNPIVTVQICTFALIWKIKPVAISIFFFT